MSEKPAPEKKLREKAEARLHTEDIDIGSMSADMIKAALHDLRVHQTELEIQNEELRAAHRETEEYRKHYFDLYHKAPVGYVMLDKKGIIRQTNNTFCRLTGLDAEDLKNKPLESLLAADDRAVFLGRYNAFFNKPENKVMECTFSTARSRPAVFRLEAIRIKAAKMLPGIADSADLLLAAVSDISAAKEIEREIRFQSQLLDAVGQSVIATDQNGRILYWNKAAERIYGWKQEEILSKNIIEVTPSQMTKQQGEEIMRHLARGETWNGEFMVRRKDGSCFPAFVSDSPVFDQKGNLAGIIGVSYDLTAAKALQKEIDLRGKRSELILKSIRDGFFALDQQMIITYFNAAAEDLLGRSAGDVIGKHFIKEAFPEAAGSVFERHYTRALRDRKPVSFETRFDVPPYTNWYEVNVYPFEDGISVYFNIITERKKSEERLGHLNAILKAIRNVNQLITHEKDKSRLIRRACRELTDTRGYFNTWIVLLDEKGTMLESASRGAGRRFSTLQSRIRQGARPRCMQLALESSGMVCVESPEEQCPDCPLSSLYEGRSAFSASLVHEGRIYGTMTVSIPAAFIDDQEERALFKEVAGDLAFALYSLNIEKALQENRANLDEAQKLSHLGRWELDIDAGSLKWTDTIYEIFELDPDKTSPDYDTFLACIHPDDRKMVDRAYTRSLETKEPYQIEHRLLLKDGRIKWLYEKCRTDYNEAGRALRSVGIVQDITDRRRAEETIAENERYLRTILETTADGFWVLDSKGRVIEVNRAYCAMSGYSREELLTMGINNIDARERPEESAARIQRIISTGYEIFETSHTRKDGTIFDVEVSVTFISSIGGRFVCFCRDLTERKQAERALKESEKRFRNVLESIQLIGVTLNTEGTLTFANDYFLQLTGYTAQEVIGKDWFTVFIPPEIHQQLRDDTFYKGLTAREIELSRENEIVTKAGERLLISWSNTLDRDLEGNPVGSTSIGQDITEQRVARDQIIAEKERAQRYLDIAGVMFIALDRSGRVIMANKKAAEILECAEGEIVGKNWFDTFLVTDDLKKVQTVFSEIIAGRIVPFEYVENLIRTKDGRPKMIAWHNTVLKDSGGAVTGTLSSGEDVTARKAAEKNLAEKINELSRFNKLMIGRELKMIELKDEINRLLAETGRPPKYRDSGA